MSRARYHKMGEAPQLSGHQEQPVGNDRSKRTPKAETQVLGAAFPDAGREAAQRAQREAEAIAEQAQGLGTLRERLGLSDSQEAGSGEVAPSHQEELHFQKRQLAGLEGYIKDSYGYTARELDADPNIINKGKGFGARMKGWLYGKVGKSTDGLLDVQLSQWRTLKKEVERKEREALPPIGYGDPRAMADARAKVTVARGRGGMSLEELDAHVARRQGDRQAAAAYRKDNYDDTNARETLKKGKIAYAAGNTERANALASALTEQAFFDDGLTLEGAVPKIKRDTERAQAAAKARNERVKKDGASQEDYDALDPDEFNALLARNMASEQELKDGALPGPYADSSMRGRGSQYSGGGSVEGAFARRGANQLLGRPVVEAPRSSVEAVFKGLLQNSERLLGHAKRAYDSDLIPTKEMLANYQGQMKQLAEERSRLADTPGLDATPEYAKALDMYRQMVELGVALNERHMERDLTGRKTEVIKDEEMELGTFARAMESLGADEGKRLFRSVVSALEINPKQMGRLPRKEAQKLSAQLESRLQAVVQEFNLERAAPPILNAVGREYVLLVDRFRKQNASLAGRNTPEFKVVREKLSRVNELLGFDAERNMKTAPRGGGAIIDAVPEPVAESAPTVSEKSLPSSIDEPAPNRVKRVPDAAVLEQKREVDRRRQEALAKADIEALAKLEASLGTDEAKRLHAEISRLLVADEHDMKNVPHALAQEMRQEAANRLNTLAKMFRVEGAPMVRAAVIQKYMALVQQTRKLGTETLRKQLAKANEVLGFSAQHNIVAPEVIPELVEIDEEEGLEDVTNELVENRAERFEGALATRPSSKHESWNEDSAIANNTEQIFAVLDGVGGHQGGEFASKFSKKYIEQNAPSLNQDDPEAVKEAMETLLKTLSVELIREAKERGIKKPGSTASLVKIIENLDGKRTAVIGTVGDSRTYVRGANGAVKFMSEDQSIAYASKKQGIMTEEQAATISSVISNIASEKELEAAIAKYPLLGYAYQNRNVIAQSIGSSENISPEVVTVDLEPGDEVIITSDGVHDNLTDKEIQQILAMPGTAQEIANMLVQKAYDRSEDGDHLRGKPDDITAVVASGPSTRKAKPAAAPRRGAVPPPVPPAARIRKAS